MCASKVRAAKGSVVQIRLELRVQRVHGDCVPTALDNSASGAFELRRQRVSTRVGKVVMDTIELSSGGLGQQELLRLLEEVAIARPAVSTERMALT